MPNLRNGNKEGFEPGLTWLRVRHSTTELPRSMVLCTFVPGAPGDLISRNYYYIVVMLVFSLILSWNSLYLVCYIVVFVSSYLYPDCHVVSLLQPLQEAHQAVRHRTDRDGGRQRWRPSSDPCHRGGRVRRQCPPGPRSLSQTHIWTPGEIW